MDMENNLGDHWETFQLVWSTSQERPLVTKWESSTAVLNLPVAEALSYSSSSSYHLQP